MLALIAYNVLRLLVKAISGLLTALWDGTERQQGVRILQKWDITPFWKREELKNMTQANTIGISRENWNKEMFFKYLENNKEFWVMANTSWLDHLGIFPKAPRLKRCSVDGKPNWSQQHYAVARKERKQNQNQKQQKNHPKIFKQTSYGVQPGVISAWFVMCSSHLIQCCKDLTGTLCPVWGTGF